MSLIKTKNQPHNYTMFFSSNVGELLSMKSWRPSIFYEKKMFDKSFNAIYIALIPKKKGAKELKEFRPIILIGNSYKLLSIVLTE